MFRCVYSGRMRYTGPALVDDVGLMGEAVDREIEFGRLLRQLRKARNLTQEALAQQAFCAIDTIKKIERGVRRPSRQLAEQFADCLALSGDERAAFLAAARAHATASTKRKRQAAQIGLAQWPHPPTPFVGRAADLAAISAAFADPATRLVTIVGPGGIGKTRLAMALGDQLLAAPRFEDGVYFVPLAALDAAHQIILAIAEAIAFPVDGGTQQTRALRQQLFDYLQAKRLLLILDNVEHLLDGTGSKGEDAADLVATLLGHAPDVAILATSRARLQLRQEQIYPLTGLDIPPTGDASRSSAVTLFVECARRLQPAFTPTSDQLDGIARICRLVDGMPLAIELAAGWMDTLSPSAIAAELAQGLDLLATDLRDIPPRHRSMRAVFDGSYQRLDAAAQSIFARLAVLRGGGTLEAVQAVTQATLPQLHSLVAASLLSYDADRSRYMVHELLRQYAAEKLAAHPQDEAATRDRHAEYYCALIAQYGTELVGPRQRAAIAALEAERENMRTASSWAAQHARVDLLMGAVGSLGYLFEWRATFEEGERAYAWIAAQFEAQPLDGETLRLIALLRAWQGNFRRMRGDLVGADQLLRQNLALLDSAPQHDLRAERAFALLQLGLVASEGPVDEARRYLEESLAIYQTLGRRWEASHALLWLGDLDRYQGNFAAARRCFQASLDIRSACGDRRGVAEVLIWDSHAAAEMGYVEEAEALARRSYALYEELGGAANQAFGLSELGVILMYAGKYAEAHDMLWQSLDLYRELGGHTMVAFVQGWLAVACLAMGEYEQARSLTQQATADVIGRRGAESGRAFMLHYSGWVALTLGAYHEAEAWLQQSVAAHRQAGNAAMVGWPLAQLGYVHWRLGNRAQAELELLEVIRTSARQHTFVPLMLALPPIALMLAEQGAAQRAVELYALAWRYPILANAQSSVDSLGKPLAAVMAALPPEAAAAAQARGQTLDLWATAAALEAELTALGWGQAGH